MSGTGRWGLAAPGLTVDLAAGERNTPVPEQAKQYECEYDEAGPSGPVRGVCKYHPASGAEFFSAAPKRSLSVLWKAAAPLPSDGGEQEEPLTAPQSVMEPLFKSFDERAWKCSSPGSGAPPSNTPAGQKSRP